MKKKSMASIIFMILFFLIALVCILYGIKIFRAGYGTGFFAVWIVLGAIFVFCGIALKTGLFARMPKGVKIALLSIIIVGLILFIWVEALILKYSDEKGEKNLDYIIVLGALVYEDRPSSILEARLNSAYEYLMENEDTVCIVSGGQGANEPFSEAEGMRRYLVKKGIDESRIIMEDKSHNTIQNLVNSKALIDNKDAKVGIVTSKFHMYRALKIAKKQGYTNVCGISAYVVPAYMPNNMFREFFGVVKDTLKGNM